MKSSIEKLFKDLPVTFFNAPVQIQGITADSEEVSTGDLFVAKRGKTFDGNAFVKKALEKGAVAILSEVFHQELKVFQIICPDISAIESILAHRFYQFPSKKLFLVGVTGTNGKTTTSYLIQHLLAAENPCGLLSGVKIDTAARSFPSHLTTQPLFKNQRYLHEMVISGCKSAVMEVSSHALDQGRVKDLFFDAAIFTNLSHEHLDYHTSMENYRDAKAKLFEMLPKKAVAIINLDDPWATTFSYKARKFTYAIDKMADLNAKDISFSLTETRCVITYKNNFEPFVFPLIGRFNVYNVLAAIAACIEFGMSLKQIAFKIKDFSVVPGRLQSVENDLGFHIFIDHAHKPIALENILQTLAHLKKGRLITIFGCGGDRDKEKRPQMAKIAQVYSDIVIVTNDNPRKEDPKAIAEEIIKGFDDKHRVSMILDREKAIEVAILDAQREDIILIAGKGHETYQIFHDEKILFDDRQIVKKLLEKFRPAKL